MVSDYIAVIQAGGKGTRMRTLTKEKIPKPMLLMNNKPLLQWQLEKISEYGIKKFVIIVGYLGKEIINFFGTGSMLDISIIYIEEKKPLGSAGALYYLKDIYPHKNFLFIFGDIFFDIEWNHMITFHERQKAIATLLVHPNSHPYDSDLIILADDNKVDAIDSKFNRRHYWYNNIVNSGIYIFDHTVLEYIVTPLRKDLEKDVLMPLILENNVYGYRTTEYVKDTGTPERFIQVNNDLMSGIPEKKNLKNKQRCVFLDRDGTVNLYKKLLYKEEDFELIDGVAEAIKKLNDAAWLVIVVTNQPVVARGLCELKDVEDIHKKMQVMLAEKGAYLDDIMFCPHHPDKGYPEENINYKMKCNCRKPAIGMIDYMRKKYNINLSESYMVGDTTIDIQTGLNAGLKTILLRTGLAGMDMKYKVLPDKIVNNLMNAVDRILFDDKNI